MLGESVSLGESRHMPLVEVIEVTLAEVKRDVLWVVGTLTSRDPVLGLTGTQYRSTAGCWDEQPTSWH